jgi:hypothetical protein
MQTTKGGYHLRALIAFGYTLATVVEHEAKVNRQVKVDAQNVSFKSSAKADSSLKINQASEQGAAGACRHGTDFDALDQT